MDQLPVTDYFIYEDEVTQAILTFKKNPDDPEVFQAIKDLGFIDVDLVCLGATRAPNGHTSLQYGVADYRQGDDALSNVLAPEIHLFGNVYRPTVPDEVRLFREATEETARGVWWSFSRLDALREGIAQGIDSAIYSAVVPRENILMRTRTKFGKGGTSPAELVVDPTDLDIHKI